MCRLRILLAMLVGLIAWPADAAPPHPTKVPTLVLDAAQSVDLVAEALTLQGDPVNAADPAYPPAVLAAVQAAELQPLRPRYSSRWLVAHLVNPAGAETVQWMLRMDTDPLYLPELFVLEGNEVVAHDRRADAISIGVPTGAAIASGQRFMLDVPAGSRRTVVLRVSAISYGSLAADILSAERYVPWAARHQAIVMAALGLLTAIGAYNLFLGAGLRSTTYVWYALHAASHVLYWATVYGLTADLAGFTDHDRVLYKVSSSLTFLAAPFFVRGLLETRRYAPRLDRALLACGCAGTAILLPTVLLMPWPEVHAAWVRGVEYQFLLALVEAPLFIVAAFMAERNRIAGARWFLVGWTTYLAAILSVVLTTYGVGRFSGTWLLTGLLGATWEAIMLSQALAARIQAIEQARLADEVRLASQERLLATVSHDLRTPLHAILGMARLLEREPLASRARWRVQAIRRSGESLLGLVSNLVDRASLDAGRLRLSPGPVNPAEIAADCVALLRDLAGTKGMQIGVEVDPHLPERVLLDVQRVKQVLIGLIDNAIKYAPHGTVVVRVGTAGDRLVVTVTDSGPGVPAAEREAIFHRFHRGSDTSPLGAGLGLAIARELAIAMGGALTVDNAPGEKGATFRLDLPLVPAAPPEGAVKPLTVLLIDDLALNRELAAATLREDGHEPLPAPPEEALAVLLAHDVHAVLVDVNMPTLDGCELVRRIRNLPNPLKAEAPVVALTAGVSEATSAELARLGVKTILTKPLVRGALDQALVRP